MPITFSEGDASTFPAGSDSSRQHVGDFDNDGDADILYQSSGSTWQYARSNGDGSYTILVQAASPFAGNSLFSGNPYFVADMDGDGRDDLASTNFYLRQSEDGTFDQVLTPGRPTSTNLLNRMAQGDFDSDGDLDFLYQSLAVGQPFRFLRNDGDNSFTDLSQAASPFAGLTLPANTAGTHYAGDFDGDGDTDLWAAVNNTTGSYFRNDGGVMTAGSSATMPAPLDATRVLVGDFDTDGDADILYQTGANGSAWQYARSNGDGTFTILNQAASPFAGLSLIDHTGSNYRTGDVDGDGDIDVIAAVNGLPGEVYFADGKPPAISASSHSEGSSGLGVNDDITLTFDESVTVGSGSIHIYRGDGVLIETIAVGSAQVTGAGATWTINPSVTLATGTNYYVQLDAETWLDADGSIFPGVDDPMTLNFTTGQAPPAGPEIGTPGDDILGRFPAGAGPNTQRGGAGDDFYFVDDAGDVIVDTSGAGDRVFANVDFVLAAGLGIEIVSTDDHAGTAALDLSGNELDNRVQGNEGDNQLDGSGGDDILVGAGGDDVLLGGAGADVLNGGAGADHLHSGAGAGLDILAGGIGDDTYHLEGLAQDWVFERVGEGDDTILTAFSYRLIPGSEIEHLFAADENGLEPMNLTGNEFDNEIRGNAGANTLRGGDGADVLFGGAENDVLYGDAGADAMAGGTGDDFYYVENAGDSVVEAVGEGADRVIVSTSWTLTAGAEVETITALMWNGTAAQDLAGNDLGQMIIGTQGTNRLEGFGGADHLIGLRGNDVLDGGDGDDMLNGGEGDDTLIGGAGDDYVFDQQGFDTLVLSGLQSEYTIAHPSPSGDAWRITDNVAGRDGVDTFQQGIERLMFSDGSFLVLLPAGAPAPTVKDAPGAQVLPAMDDAARPDPAALLQTAWSDDRMLTTDDAVASHGHHPDWF